MASLHVDSHISGSEEGDCTSGSNSSNADDIQGKEIFEECSICPMRFVGAWICWHSL